MSGGESVTSSAPMFATENLIGRIGTRVRSRANGPRGLVADNAIDAGPDKVIDGATTNSVPLMRAL